MQYRDYQLQAVDAAREAIMQGHRMIVLVAPCGAGKTVVALRTIELALQRSSKVLFLTHTEEIIGQTSARLSAIGVTHGVIKAGRRTALNLPVQIASIPTLVRRLDTKPPANVVLIDEVQHIGSRTWRAVADAYPSAVIVGLTATPSRLDGQGLGSAGFTKLIVVATIPDLIRRGYLVPAKVWGAPPIDLSSVETVAGDFNRGQLGAVMDRPKLVGNVVQHWERLALGRPTIVFASRIDHSKHLAEEFLAHGHAAEHIDGTMSDRRSALDRFRAGETRIITTVALLTEGADFPACSCVVMARPTMSRGMFCLDSETEALTPAGWVRGASLTDNDEVAAWDSTTGEVMWERVLVHVSRPLLSLERMLALRSDGVDLRVTDTHRMVWRARERLDRRHRTPWMVASAGELSARSDSWELPVSGYQRTAGVALHDDELRFIAWVQTDGSVNRKTGVIQISQSTGSAERCHMIESVLCGCAFKWRYSDYSQATNFGPRRHPQRAYRVSRGKPRVSDKHLTGWARLAAWIPKVDPSAWARLEGMDARQWGVFLDAWHQGDGSKHNSEGQNWTRRSYHLAVKDKTVADWLQSMCVRRGWRSSVSPQANLFMVRAKKAVVRSIAGTNQRGRPHLVETPTFPDEQVWCVSVPSGAFIVRRNGKSCVVGNCQMAGRGLRTDCDTCDGTDAGCLSVGHKRTAILIDHAGNHMRHGFVDDPETYSLDGREKRVRDAVMGLRTCLQCFAVSRSTAPRCELCGAPFPVRKQEIRHEDGELQEVTPAQRWAARAGDDARVKSLAKWMREGKDRGYKPTWPLVRYRALFHQWPGTDVQRKAEEMTHE